MSVGACLAPLLAAWSQRQWAQRERNFNAALPKIRRTASSAHPDIGSGRLVVETMQVILRWQEVVVPIAVVLLLIILKHVSGAAALPKFTGIICFAYALTLVLRLMQSRKPGLVAGWSELRAAGVELFGAVALGFTSAFMLATVIVLGMTQRAPYADMVVGMTLSMVFAIGAAAIAFTSLLVKLRWNHAAVEHTSGFGKLKRLAWSEVISCRRGPLGIVITGANRMRITFLPFHAGAQALERHAIARARENAHGHAAVLALARKRGSMNGTRAA